MFTVCPKCTLTLAVTANDLRVGQGYVRCGRCSNVFNALLKLSEAPDEAYGDGGPPIAQADPASRSQITRAMSSEAANAAATNAAATNAAAANGAAAHAAATPPASPRSAPGGFTAPATPSPATPSPATLSPATPSPAASGPGAAASATATRTAGATPAAGVSRASTAAATVPAHANPAQHAAQAQQAASVPRTVPAPRTAPAPLSAQAPRAAQAAAAAPAHAAQASRVAGASQPAQPRQAGGAALPPGTANARATTSSVAPTASARGEPSPFASPPAGGPQHPNDDEGIDQFELVLQTLGLSLDEDEPPVRPPSASTEAPGESDASAAPTRMVENIVLEGDGVSQSQAEVPDKPLDELDQFTRRLSRPSGKAGRSPATRDPAAPDAPARDPQAGAPAGRPAAPGPARRATDRQPPQSPTANGRGVQAPTRRSHEAPGLREARGSQEARASQEAREFRGLDEFSFEEDAALDDASLDDPMLDEALPAESVVPIGDEPASADLEIAALEHSPYRWAWLAGCLLLALLLLLQILGHWRERLAVSPTWGGPVRALYAAVGAPIAPRWDLSAYEVHQQGAESEPGQRAQILVRFSLANHATRAQPVPMLRLTLLDRYGRRVAQRDLTPADYWPQGRTPATFLASDERIDTQVQVRDPSADSASFELDVCLRDTGGALRCAGDASLGAAGAAAGVDGAP